MDGNMNLAYLQRLGKALGVISLGALALFGLVAGGCDSGSSTPPVPTTNIALGQWGGAGINLVVTAVGANVGFHCATGTINNPIIVDTTGHFSNTGTFRQSGPATTAIPATYTGTVTGTTMTLNVTVNPGLAPTSTNYTLTQGVTGDTSSGGLCPG